MELPILSYELDFEKSRLLGFEKFNSGFSVNDKIRLIKLGFKFPEVEIVRKDDDFLIYMNEELDGGHRRALAYFLLNKHLPVYLRKKNLKVLDQIHYKTYSDIRNNELTWERDDLRRLLRDYTFFRHYTRFHLPGHILRALEEYKDFTKYGSSYDFVENFRGFEEIVQKEKEFYSQYII